MATSAIPILPLADMEDGQEADVFVVMTSKVELRTRDNKPYFKVGFRDHRREVVFPIWGDSTWADDCRRNWTPGAYYKIRATYRESVYGPQLEIRKIREVTPADAEDGFDPADFLPQSRFDPQAMFDELRTLASDHIEHSGLRQLVFDILDANRAALLVLPAARRNHHAFAGGLLEHVLSVTRTCAYLAARYDDYYPELEPRLDRGLVVAGAILHDIGKLRELQWQPEGPAYTAAGNLIGHILQGRDLLREAAAGRGLPEDLLLRLEHIIVSHQRLPEWGSPKPPMTPEALIVHYADDLDARYHMAVAALRDDKTAGIVTGKNNPLGQVFYRGG